MTKPRIISRSSLQKENEYRRNINLSIQLNRWTLKAMRVWPCSSEVSRLEKYFDALMHVVYYFLISCLFVPSFLYMLLDVHNTPGKLKVFGPLSFCVMAYLKYFSLAIHADEIRECFERIEWDWKNKRYSKDTDIMVADAIFGRRLVKICIFFMYSGFAFYYITLPINRGKVTVGNVTFIPMVFPVSNLFPDVRHSPVNEIFFGIQFMGGIVIHGVAATACSLAAAFAVHACGQVKVLIGWMDNLLEGRADMSSSVDDRISSIVSQHVRVLKFLSVTEEALQSISFVEFTGCTLNLCLLGYHVIKEWDPNDITESLTFFILLISLTFNIFIFCYIGELVAKYCSKIGEVAYMIDWYKLQGSRKRSVVLMIAMANTETRLTAGNMVELSLSTFGDVRIEHITAIIKLTDLYENSNCLLHA
ncbi:odorant receptor 4-like isoform X2 [Nomia melanderi]|uniref:odorant receptor 4-like isoform X2 n=1 Tax=Nomia melanderi TaxID=2448451 RepID=UPI003FCD601F